MRSLGASDRDALSSAGDLENAPEHSSGSEWRDGERFVADGAVGTHGAVRDRIRILLRGAGYRCMDYGGPPWCDYGGPVEN